MSTLAMILTAAVVVSGNGPDKVSGEVVKEPSEIDRLVLRTIGLKVRPAAKKQVQSVSSWLHGGLTVIAVREDGLADRAGIQKGDILVGLSKWETVSLRDIRWILIDYDPETISPMRFFVIRNDTLYHGRIK